MTSAAVTLDTATTHPGPQPLPREVAVAFATRLCARRQALGLSQAEVENLADLGKGTISTYETGRRAPTLAILCKISRTLSVSIDWLAGGYDEGRAA